MKTSKGIGKVLEFCGDDLKNWPMDERATLTNMVVEAGGNTGIMSLNESTLEYSEMPGSDPDEVRKGIHLQRSGCAVAAVFEIDLDELLMVRYRVIPRQRYPDRRTARRVKIDAAYGVHARRQVADMDMYAEVLQNALAQGKARRARRSSLSSVWIAEDQQYARERVTFRSLNRWCWS